MYIYIYLYIYICGHGWEFCALCDPTLLCTARDFFLFYFGVMFYHTTHFHHQPFLRSVHKTCFPCKKLFDHHSCLPNGINLFYLPSFIALSVTSIIVLPFHTLRRGSSVGLPFIFLKLPYHSKLLRKMLFYPHLFLSEVIDFIHLWESLFYHPSLLAHSKLLSGLISLLPLKILSNHPLSGVAFVYFLATCYCTLLPS